MSGDARFNKESFNVWFNQESKVKYPPIFINKHYGSF